MPHLITILTIVDVVIALLLIAVVLVQPSKDGGFGGAPFGGAGEAIFGGHAADHLSKFTVILTTLFFVVTLSLAIVTGRRPGGTVSVMDATGQQEMTAPADVTPPGVKMDNEEMLELLEGEDVVPEKVDDEAEPVEEPVFKPADEEKKPAAAEEDAAG